MTTHTVGTTVISMAYLPANQAWMVWREDRPERRGWCVALHPSKAEALADYQRRVEFLDEVTRLSDARRSAN